MQSKLNIGSVFTVSIPVKHVAEHAVDHRKTITDKTVDAELDIVDTNITFDSEKPLLLIIDDNKDIQKLIGELMNSDYNIITASNGRDGVRMAAKHVPDLIICDVMMPVMDGLECCRRIKEEVTTSHIPVLMLTACSMDEQRVQGYESGVDGYLAKPFNSAVLKSRCANLIANRKRIKELLPQSLIVPVGKKNTSASGNLQKTNSATGIEAIRHDIDNDFYNRFIEIFSDEMGNPDLSVDMIASKMGLERSQFYRKIKALTNYSPVELIRQLRLKKARILIISTEKTISEIAYEIGFSTPAYFTKCYREAYGETPSEARNKLTK